MKRIALLAAAALVAGCADASQPLAPAADAPAFDEVGPATAHAAGTGASVDYFEVDFTTDGAPFVECVGENVHLFGTSTHHQRTLFLPDGSIKVIVRGVGDELTMTGLESGRTWTHSTAESEVFTFHISPDGTQMATHASMLRYLADGDYPDLYLRHRYHLLIDETGHVVGGWSTPDEFMCQETGRG